MQVLETRGGRSAVDVAVVGGGIAGLAAAYELHTRGVGFALFEGAARVGGVILTERVDGFTIDAGPDSLLTQKPAAIELCQDVGLGEQLVSVLPPRTAFVVRSGALHPIPEGSVLGVPTRIRPFVTSRLFSLGAKLRMAMDLVVPRRELGAGEDESVGSFFRRRFGQELVTYLAEPLLGGIHVGDVERLSMRALIPRLLEAEQRCGSVIRGVRTTARHPSGHGLFRSLSGGVADLVNAVAGRLPEGSIRCGTCVRTLEGHGPYTLHFEGGAEVQAGTVILAVPAYAAAELLASLDPRLSSLCRAIPYVSTATVVLAYPRDAVQHPLKGTGFVVPRAEPAISILAGSWVSSKWPRRAPPDMVLTRVFLGGPRDPEVLDRSDEELVHRGHSDLQRLLGITGQPCLARVYRWRRANVQYEVGHLDTVAQIEQRLEQQPGLYLTGNGFRGVGIPDCVADGRATARAAVRRLERLEGPAA